MIMTWCVFWNTFWTSDVTRGSLIYAISLMSESVQKMYPWPHIFSPTRTVGPHVHMYLHDLQYALRCLHTFESASLHYITSDQSSHGCGKLTSQRDYKHETGALFWLKAGVAVSELRRSQSSRLPNTVVLRHAVPAHTKRKKSILAPCRVHSRSRLRDKSFIVPRGEIDELQRCYPHANCWLRNYCRQLVVVAQPAVRCNS